MKYNIIKIQEHKEWANQAADWFHQKWGIPKEAYMESMDRCIENKSSVPQWYIVINEENIVAGIGVIENDFHDRKDLSPNVCAVYVEEAYRKQGIAKAMLNYACDDFNKMGINLLYLITDHTHYYEQYGWEFVCMVQGDGEPKMTRMYVHKS